MQPRFSPTPSILNLPRLGLFVCAIILLSLTACEFENLTEPRVVDVTVDPSSIQYQVDTEDFTVFISVANFNEEIEDAVAFYEDGSSERDTDLVGTEVEIIDGNEIIIDKIPFAWFQGQEPGIYDIGVRINSATIEVTERNLATVQITD